MKKVIASLFALALAGCGAKGLTQDQMLAALDRTPQNVCPTLDTSPQLISGSSTPEENTPHKAVEVLAKYKYIAATYKDDIDVDGQAQRWATYGKLREPFASHAKPMSDPSDFSVCIGEIRPDKIVTASQIPTQQGIAYDVQYRASFHSAEWASAPTMQAFWRDALPAFQDATVLPLRGNTAETKVWMLPDGSIHTGLDPQ